MWMSPQACPCPSETFSDLRASKAMSRTATPSRMPSPNKRINGKVIVAGPAATGKTCLLERFVNEIYAADDAAHGPTLGCDCLQKSVFVDDLEVRLFLYDTAGQERFADMAASYFRIGEICLLCFDLNNLATFDSVSWWRKKVCEHSDSCSFILVGNKQDLVTEASLDIGPISRWAEKEGIPFFQTSAKKGGENIKFLFHTVAEKIVRRSLTKQQEDDNVKLASSAFTKPKSGGCC